MKTVSLALLSFLFGPLDAFSGLHAARIGSGFLPAQRHIRSFAIFLASAEDAVPETDPEEPLPAPTPVRQPKRLDPLVASLTRMDPDTAKAPTMKAPVVGELQLDKSLFVFLPVAVFAILGFLSSFYVALNSGDAFVAALERTSEALSQPAGTVIEDPSACRGLCSSQEDSLESLRSYMNGFAKK